jgi:hypothetical protein
MSLHGAFATMPLPDLLQWLSEARRTGSLTVTLGLDERGLRFEDGRIAAIGADDPLERDFGRVLLARGLCDLAALGRALDARARLKKTLAEVLVDSGTVGRVALTAAMRAHAREVVLSLFLWQEGSFVFSGDGALLGAELRPPEHVLAEPLPAVELLLEGMRRVDEWKRIVAIFPSDYTQVYALADDPLLPVLRFLRERAEPVALGELVLLRPESRYELYEQLYQAQHKGLLAIDATPSQVNTPDSRSPVDLLCEAGRSLLAERQFDEAVALLRAAQHLDPYRPEVRALLVRAHDEHLATLYEHFPPYRVPQLARPRMELNDWPLSPRERYLAARVSGQVDVATLAVITPLGELETLRLLERLVRRGAVRMTGT